MKHALKFIIAGFIVIFIGVIVLIIGLAVNNWKFYSDFKTQTFTAQNESDKLEIHLSAGKLDCEYAEIDKVKIEYPENEFFGYTVTEENGVIKIITHGQSGLESCDNDGISIPVFAKIPDVKVLMPKSVKYSLDIHVSAAVLKLGDGSYSDVKLDVSAGTFTGGKISCEKLDVKISAGSVEIDELASKKCIIDLSVGAIKINFAGKKPEYNISVDVSAGTSNTGNQTSPGADKIIDITISAGACELYFKP